MARTRGRNLELSNIKRTLFVLITILFLIGILLTAMGSSFHAVYSEFEVFIESSYFRPVEFFILIGVFMVMISVVGYTGVIKVSTLIINLFSFSLVLLLILEISTIVVGFNFSSSIYSNVESNMNNTLKHYKKCYAAEKAWGCIQSRLLCCGINSPYDWASEDVNGTLVEYKNKTFTIPESCCENSDCAKFYESGCIDVLGNYASDSIVTITGCVSVVFIIQLFGVMLSFVVGRDIRPAKTQREIERQRTVQKICEEINKTHNIKVDGPVLYTPSSTEA